MSVTPSPSVWRAAGETPAKHAKSSPKDIRSPAVPPPARVPAKHRAKLLPSLIRTGSLDGSDSGYAFLPLRQLPRFAGSIRPDHSNFQDLSFDRYAYFARFPPYNTAALWRRAGLPPARAGPGALAPAGLAAGAIIGPPGRH